MVIALIDAGMAMRLLPHRDATLFTLRGIAFPLVDVGLVWIRFGRQLTRLVDGRFLSVLRHHVAWPWLAGLAA